MNEPLPRVLRGLRGIALATTYLPAQWRHGALSSVPAVAALVVQVTSLLVAGASPTVTAASPVAEQAPDPVVSTHPGQSPGLTLRDDWRRYVVGPSSRDVLPAKIVRFEGVQDPDATLAPDGHVATMAAGSNMVVDFGRVVSGKVELVTGAGSGGNLTFSFSESLAFLKEGSDESRYGLGDIAYGPPPSPSSWTSPYRRTFRYLLVRASAPVAIDAIRLYFTPPIWPDSRPYGHFLSSDDELNRIWYHGVYTLQLVTASGTATNAEGTWEPVRGQLDVASSSWRNVGLSRMGSEWRDYTFSFKLTVAPGSSGAGWVMRATSAGYYLWELVQPDGDGPAELRRWKGQEGGYSLVGVSKLDRRLVPGQQMAVGIVLEGATMATHLDGVVVDTTTDMSFEQGAVGFRAVGNQHFYVDDVLVMGKAQPLFADDFSDAALRTDRWSAAQPTVLLDGAKRDRAVGTGDLAIAGRSYYLAGGDPALVRDLLKTLARYQAPSGQLPAGIYGPNMTSNGSVDLRDYSLWWTLVLRDYVLETGDLTSLRDLAPALDRVLSWAAGLARSDGLLDRGTGLDWYWTWPKRGGTSSYFNALYVGALNASADLYRWLDRDPGPLKERATQVRAAMNASLWDSEAGAYVDSASLRTSHPLDGNALAVYFGVADGEKSSAILSYVRQTMWSDWGSHTSDQAVESQYHNRTIWPAVVHYEVAARFAEGDATGAYDLLRRTWGNMLNTDPASTFWEFAGPEGQVYDGFDSLAHGWSTGPVSELMRDSLGVRPIEPGYSIVLIAPKPGTVEWEEGRVPTPLGSLDVVWRRDGTALSLSVSVPPGMRAVVAVPAGPQLLHNGQTVMSEAKPESVPTAELDSSPRSFLTVGPGVHEIVSGPGT